ncbi:MAG: hypothetical protein ACYCXW_15660 [Solirubrobacteraceae bacterium]
MTATPRSRIGAMLLAATRVWLPLAIALAGVVLIVLGHADYKSITANSRSLESAAGVALLIVAMMVWMVNWLFRLSLRSNAEREQEEAARQHFAQTGRWPDEE